jgi:predicted ester cyclase
MPPDNASVVKKALEAANEGQADHFTRAFRGDQSRNLADSLKNIRTAFPDVKYALDHVQAEGDQVTFAYTAKGTHKGALGQLRPTNKAVQWHGWGVATIKDGAIVDIQTHEDWVRAGIQLGVNPSLSGTWNGSSSGTNVTLQLTQNGNAVSGTATLAGAGDFPVSGTNNFPNVQLQGTAFGLPVTFAGAFSGPNAVPGNLTVQGFPSQAVTLSRA